MSTKETINPAEAPQVEKSKSLGIKKIEGKEFYIVGVNHTRGAPSKFSKESDKGPDGKVDYYTIKTETPFDLEYKDEGVIPIDSFFVNAVAYQQIERIPNAIEGLNNGARLGPCKSVLRPSNKTDGYDYRCLAFESDPDF